MMIKVVGLEKDATAPDAPTGLTATAAGATRINLVWTAPSDGGADIEGYKIEYSRSGNPGTWSAAAAHTARMDITIPITQSTPKATVFVGGGIVSIVDYQGL